MQMSCAVVRRCASYWQTRGLLREEKTDRYKLNQEEEAINSREAMEEEEDESAIASAEQQKEQELQVSQSTEVVLHLLSDCTTTCTTITID